MNIYTHGHHESVLRSHRWRTVENSAANLLPHLETGMVLLDVGCGPGTITVGLAQAVGPTGRVVAIDPSEIAIAAARDEAERAGVDNLTFEVADIEAFAPTCVGNFDVVHAHQVLQHVPDPVVTLQAMRQATCRGGLVAARDADYGAMAWFPSHPDLEDWRRVYREVARRNGGEPDAGRRLLAWARAAGFDEIVPSASAWCYATPEDRSWWGGLWADRMLRSSVAQQAQDQSLATVDDLERVAAAWRAWAEDETGWFTVINGEILCTA